VQSVSERGRWSATARRCSRPACGGGSSPAGQADPPKTRQLLRNTFGTPSDILRIFYGVAPGSYWVGRSRQADFQGTRRCRGVALTVVLTAVEREAVGLEGGPEYQHEIMPFARTKTAARLLPNAVSECQKSPVLAQNSRFSQETEVFRPSAGPHFIRKHRG